MQQLPVVKPCDQVEIIAPASRCTDKHLYELKEILESWQLHCIISDEIFGNDLLCANTDAIRGKLLKSALYNPDTTAIICARGGYGSLRLIPELAKLSPPSSPKLFIGMSDITALHLYIQQEWQWPTLHGALALDKFSPESIASLQAILFGKVDQVEFTGIPLNTLAEKNQLIEATLTGGNLCLVQTSIGTSWQLDARNKIIFLEEVGERGYRIDRSLEHLSQAHIFQDAAAIILGDFTEGNEPNGESLIMSVLKRFAQNCKIPVIKIEGIGHGYTNYPLPLGTKSKLQLGKDPKLVSLR